MMDESDAITKELLGPKFIPYKEKFPDMAVIIEQSAALDKIKADKRKPPVHFISP